MHLRFNPKYSAFDYVFLDYEYYWFLYFILFDHPRKTKRESKLYVNIFSEWANLGSLEVCIRTGCWPLRYRYDAFTVYVGKLT